MNKTKTLWNGFQEYVDYCIEKGITKFKYIDACRYIIRIYGKDIDEDSELYLSINNLKEVSTLRNYIRYCLILGFFTRYLRGEYIINKSISSISLSEIRIKIQEQKLNK